MSVKIISKHVKVTEAIREKIESKFEKLEKYINDDFDVHVKIDVKRKNQSIEATVYTKHGTIVRAEECQEDLYSAIDLLYDKLYKQLRKYKTQMIRRNRKNESIRFDNIEEYEEIDLDDDVIKRRKKFKMDKPITPEDAIVQMNLLGHQFFLFRNIETNKTSIIYKRHDGYGLIEQV
ncbi:MULTISPECIES: ribosome hibernation-promoting factor, HPF/YfiA family [Romboutsia]|uniref:Ribosome hibernation promoting factor n=1 Tax=Romboutsia hominis TaxID=1507512 RepID=A0A2P2BN81_9FIRM|nr:MULTISPECIES: ribosome-associated translation inhibitor RaiA [Romboutsia]MCH1958469.1 ribosome-associated translation inhibitor RaiA [Romboutsia hominis]MDB8790027.1 ribosome-associated translation inhibitor RaiA [Romboutsia sp. 1001216sp1]MDB8793074.1 ribosome-associated translation inhibitor RaiA [Romboutsia sp. 1001216sp1]MDB8795867.1 ribosome-associated translation inhibitor RaiA [Romboutsia sp. 1001216sp1]MDB8799362.1 ribosome-associated translation inhibitor RaiA [Romboutsia sp. 10012